MERDTSHAGIRRRGIQTAERKNCEAIIFQLNTPGGNIEPMNEIVQDIRSSKIR